jgi:uncharacterized protein YbbC (DUF1343 family)
MKYFLWLLAMTASLLSVTDVSAQPRFRYDVKMGIDQLIENNYDLIAGKKVVLVTNQSGRTRTLLPTVSAVRMSQTTILQAVLTPEHGYYGVARAGETVADSADSLDGIPLRSLYGSTRRPTREMLGDCDVVLFDVQDIGLRSYTFLSTLYNVMDACAEYNKPLIVLDRPNPLGGKVVDGNVPDSGMTSFVGIIPIPYVHGCTFGELARMTNEEGWLPRGADSLPRHCALTVVPMQNWERWMSWEDTDFIWTPTSPHIPTVDALRGAAMTGVWGELGIASIGIGYTLPFQMFGTPTLKTKLLLEVLQKRSFPGITMIATRYRPFYGKYVQQDCNGLMFSFYSDINFQPYTAGVELLLAVRSVHPEMFIPLAIPEGGGAMFDKVTGSRSLLTTLFSDKPDADIRAISARGVQEFLEKREKYLLYE